MIETFFISILSMSTIASIVFFIILFARKIINGKVTLENSILLWVIFIIVLIIPLNFQSRLSVKNFLDTEESFVLTESKNFLVNDIMTNTEQMLEKSEDREINFTEIFSTIWFIVTFLLIVTDICAYRNLKRKNSFEIPEDVWKIFNDCKKELNIKSDIKLVVQEKVNTPSLYGIFETKILLTEEILKLSELELKCIFTHELYHYKNNHHILYLFFEIIERIHWFNPFIKIAFKTIREDFEIITDSNVLKSDITVKEYCKTILKIAEICSLSNVRMPSICGGKKDIERRIIQMKNSCVKNSIFIIVIAILLVSILTISLATDKISNDTNENNEVIIQMFDEIDNQEEAEKVNYIVPVEYTKVSARFGTRVHPITKEEITHTGIDLVAEEGTKVKAAADGIVVSASYDSKRGNYVELKHIDGSISAYCHGSKILVEVGDCVKVGEHIMTVGKTGQATGPHLHFEVRNADGEYMDVNVLIEGLFE